MFEYYREKFLVTEWRDGSVYATESQGCAWFEDDVVDRNIPADTNVIYAFPSSDFKVSAIRRRG